MNLENSNCLSNLLAEYPFVNDYILRVLLKNNKTETKFKTFCAVYL